MAWYILVLGGGGVSLIPIVWHNKGCFHQGPGKSQSVSRTDQSTFGQRLQYGEKQNKTKKRRYLETVGPAREETTHRNCNEQKKHFGQQVFVQKRLGLLSRLWEYVPIFNSNQDQTWIQKQTCTPEQERVSASRYHVVKSTHKKSVCSMHEFWLKADLGEGQRVAHLGCSALDVLPKKCALSSRENFELITQSGIITCISR